MMEKIENREFEFSFAAILKIFKGKLKVIIAVALIAAILGGAFGAFMIFFTQRFYGNLLTFYLPVSEQSGYSSILPLLESDIFLQKILIDTTEESYTVTQLDAQGQPLLDANGQPITVTEVIRVPNLPFSDVDKANYKKYTFEKIQAQKTIDELKKYFNDIPYTRTTLKEDLDRKSADYSTAVSVLNTYMSVQDELAKDPDVLSNIKELETKRVEALNAKKEAELKYNACIDEYRTNELTYHNAKETIDDLDEEIDKILAPLYEAWKRDSKNSEMISLAEDGIKYSFDKKELYPDELELNKEKEEEKQPTKFLYIKVQINQDKELADKIINNITTEMQDFIKDHATPSSSNDIIKTTCISVPVSHTIYESSLLFMLAKYVILFVGAAEIVLIAIIAALHFKKKVFANETEQDKIQEHENKDEISEANE